MTLRVALTGNVASGKSTVAERFRAAGLPVVSADEVAREVVAPGTEGLARIREVFGPEVIAADGTLDRARMRERVFSDPDARRRLEGITHPRIRAAVDRWIESRAAEGAPVVVAEIPLLFETGRDADFDRIVFVDAPAEERLRRMVDDRGLSAEVARGIMASQGDPEEKRRRAHHRIDNDGSIEQLHARADAVLDWLRASTGAAPESPPFAPERPAPDGWMRLDLHMHTRASWDCLSDPEKVLAHARRRGVERIAITDHNELWLAAEMAERHPESVIAGEEVKTAEGIDVIGLYLTEVIPKGTPAVETCRRIREQGGIAYLPHPYARGKGGGGRMADELAALCEVVEVFNARLHPGRLNHPAPDLATRHGCLRGAGSDAHTVGEVAGAWVEVPVHPNTPDGLRRALARGRVHGRTSSNFVHLASTWAKIRKKLSG
ncbi:dephospho-CoA kinase [Gaopeijia maritima]|uniref:Dephospho-CoA kinase n=1 Tax=Gaopeijia maritima TaxID=3119007 RepID=A0ABU9EA24_9BACT